MKRHYQKIIFIVLVLSIIVVFSGINFKIAQAQNTGSPVPADAPSDPSNTTNAPNALEDVATMAVYPIVLGLGQVLIFIGKAFFTLAGSIIDLALRLNGLVLKNPMVNIGWNVVLSFANLGFVLGIIIIAISTILRIQQYGAKNLLGKLIAAALLINFSLMIAGVFMDSADVFTNFFNKQFGGANLSTKLTALIGPQALSDPFNTGGQMGFAEKYSRTVLKLVDAINPFYWTGYAEGLEKMMWGDNKSLTAGNWLMILTSFFFAIFFTFLSVLVLLAVGIMLFIRYLYLVFLLIISPIVWLFWIFPGTSNLWENWWKHFIRWTYFAPVMMFFLFLAISLMGVAPLSQPANQDAYQFVQQLQAKQQSLPIDLMKLGNMVIVLGLIMGGLMAANSMGIHGSKAFIGVAGAAGNWVRGKVGNWANTGRRNIVDRIRTAGKEYNPNTNETTTTLQRIGSRLQRVPLMHGLGSYVARQGTEVPRARAQDIENLRQRELASLTNEAIITRATGRGAFFNPTAAAALGQELARRNLTNDPRVAPLTNRFVEIAERMGNAQTIYNNRPELVQARPGETREAALSRAMRGITVGNIPLLSHQSVGIWNNPNAIPTNEQINIALNISNPQLGRLGTEANPQQVEAIRNTIRHTLDQHTAGRLQLNQNQQNQLTRIVDFINNNPNWQNIP